MAEQQSAASSATHPAEPTPPAQQLSSALSTTTADQPCTANTSFTTAQESSLNPQPASSAHPTTTATASAPAPASKAPLFLSQASTSAAPSPSAAALDSNGDAGMDEVDELDEELQQQASAVMDPRKTGKEQVPVTPVVPAASTSSNATAGPGPSSTASAAAREATPVKKQKNGGIFPGGSGSGGAGGGGMPASFTSPAKKKKPRVSAPSAGGVYVPPPLPHYTVRRSNGTNSRSNPHLIVFNDDVSDGNSAAWPPPQERIEGHTRHGKPYYYECEGKNVGRHKSLRESVGKQLAEKLGLLQGSDEFWALEGLPKEYLFTIHHCVTGSNQARTDTYIFGSAATLKFRTANEISPHLYWLLTHGPDDASTCQCKYCTKKTQGEINRTLGLPDGRASSVASQASTSAAGLGAFATGPRAAKIKKDKKFDKSAVAATMAVEASFFDEGGHNLLGSEKARRKEEKKRRRALEEQNGSSSKAAKKPRSASRTPEPKPAYTGAYVNRQRDADLMDLFSYRIGDLVWAELPTPLVPSKECLKAAELAAEQAEAVAEQVASGGGGEGLEEMRQVALSRRNEANVLKGETITHWPGIVNERVPKLKSKIKEKTDRQPQPLQEGETILNAEGERMFEFVDGKGEQEWRYKVQLLALSSTVDSLRPNQVRTWLAHPPPTTLWNGPMMIEERAAKHVWDAKKRETRMDCKLEAFGGKLEEALTALALALQIAAHVVGSYCVADRMRIDSDMIKLDPNVGAAPENKKHVDRQTNSWSYQCLCWGAERLWCGDMVRLMFNGPATYPTPPPAEHVTTSVSPAQTPLLAVQPSPGTARRTLFMRIDNIFKNSSTNRTQVAGDIYELRDLRDDPPLADGKGNVDGTTTGTMSMFEKKAPRQRDERTASPASIDGEGEKDKNPLYRLPDSAYTASHTLPAPPPLYEWRLLSSPTRHTACEVEHLAGRYHPIARGSLLEDRNAIDTVLESPTLGSAQVEGREQQGEGGGGSGAALSVEERAVVLAGLRPAFRLFMRCGRATASRYEQFLNAEKTASEEVSMYFARVEQEGTTGTPQPQYE
ncbi:hypothetical protein JCM11251_001534 [Rhodosporidiobolus azoricus]